MSSIHKIAEMAGVSAGTVDRVLHNRRWVARETEERVRRAIKKLNYKPNIFARNLKLTKTFTFGALLPQKQHDNRFWEIPVNGINRAQKELESHKVRIKYFFYDRNSEKDFLEYAYPMLDEKLDGLLIAPLLSEQVKQFIKKIPSSLPYVFFDSKIDGTDYLTYIGQDHYKSGIVSARLMKLLMQSGGMVAVINTIPRYHLVEERTRAFISFFRNDPKYYLRSYDLDSTEEKAGCVKLLDEIINKNNTVKGLFLPSAAINHFSECIYTNRLNKKIHVIGYNLMPITKKYMLNGTIDVLINPKIENQAYQGVYALYRHCILREPVPKEIMMPIDIVIKESLDS